MCFTVNCHGGEGEDDPWIPGYHNPCDFLNIITCKSDSCNNNPPTRRRNVNPCALQIKVLDKRVIFPAISELGVAQPERTVYQAGFTVRPTSHARGPAAGVQSSSRIGGGTTAAGHASAGIAAPLHESKPRRLPKK